MVRNNRCGAKSCNDSTSDSTSVSSCKSSSNDSCTSSTSASCKSSSSDSCKTNKKCEKSCPSYNAQEILCKYKNAVVQIHSEFILIGADQSCHVNGATPLSANGRADIILEGNGFFICGHYIIAPAHLVLLPPSLTSVANRFPFHNNNNLELGTIKDQMIRASRILVSVFNVNDCGLSYVYEADLVGVDGAGDIAVLNINQKKQWNHCNPCIEKSHPTFKIGKSRAAKNGERVFLIGDYVTNILDRNMFNAAGAITEGLVSDHRYLDYSGSVLAETILVSAEVGAFGSGLPIINEQGQVIGMQTTNISQVLPRIIDEVREIRGPLNKAEGFGLVSGPSEYFMRKVIKTLINGTCSRKHNCQIECICDPAGSYYRYRKGYAGIAYDVFTGVDYDTTADYTSGNPFAGLPKIRLTPSGEFLNYPSCKELIGIRVLGLAGANPNDSSACVNNGHFYVPGGEVGLGSILPNDLPTSPFLGKLQPGDVITHVNGIPLGDLNKQIAPSLITWRLCCDDQIEICYRRGGNVPNNFDNCGSECYDGVHTFTACLKHFPYLLDYPWYAVNIFPLLSNAPYNFEFGQQLHNPQYPQYTNGAIFRPAF